jgi:hypothetical protein
MQKQKKQRDLVTSAGCAAAAIDKTLVRLELRRQRRLARVGLAKEMHKAFARLWTSDLIQRDPQARNIMLRMARAKNIRELDCEIDLLAIRISQLLGKARTKGKLAPLSVARTGSRSRALRSRGNDEADAPLSRTFLTL